MNVVIIGGGVTGLVAAYRLSEIGKGVTVLEKQEDVGGVLASIKKDNYYIEKYYHHVFKGDSRFIQMVNELGLSNEFRFSNARTAFLYGDRFVKLTTPKDLLFFKPLSFFDKIRLGILILIMKRVSDFKKYDDISAKEWIVANAGKNVFEKFFGPMLRGKFGDNLNEISAAWFIERIKTRSKRSFSGERLGYIDGGFHLFIQRLAEGICRNGGLIRTNVEVRNIRVENNKVEEIAFDDETIRTSMIISTIPPRELTRIVEFDSEFGRKLDSLDYQGCICVLFGFKRKITDYYWTNIIRDDIVFGAIVEHTNFQRLSNYGEHIIYLASYPEGKSRLWGLSDGRIFEIYFEDLKKILPDLKEEEITWKKVVRDKYGGLIYRKGIKSNIANSQTSINGLLIGGMFNSYPDRNINTSIRIGEECAKLASWSDQ